VSIEGSVRSLRNEGKGKGIGGEGQERKRKGKTGMNGRKE